MTRKNLAFIILALLASVGCSKPTHVKEGIFEGYECIAEKSTKNRKVVLQEGNNNLIAIDYNPYGEFDGRFDEIKINLPRGHPLEKYVNLQDLERAYKYIMKKGR